MFNKNDIIYKWLTISNIEFSKKDIYFISKNGLCSYIEFKYYLPTHNTVIEVYDKKINKNKEKYAQMNNIKLLKIHYSERNNIKKIFDNFQEKMKLTRFQLLDFS